ncbi:MAG: diguanylate cyclase [Vulcanimicrobiota bacterium]
MSRQHEYRKPRNKELHDLAWTVPFPIRITDPKGAILWQNREAEEFELEVEWTQSPTTWQSKKAFLKVPARVDHTEALARAGALETDLERLKRQQKDTARKKRQAETRLKSGERELESARKSAARLEQQLAAQESQNEQLKATIHELEEKLQDLPSAPPAPVEVDNEARVKELELQIARLSEDKQAMETWVEELEQNRDEIDLQLQRTQRELLEVKEEFTGFRSRVEEEDAERKLQEQLAEKVAEFEELEQTLEQEQRVFESQKAELQAQLVSQESELEELKAEFQNRSSEQQAAQVSKRELGRLQEKLEALEELKQEREELLNAVRQDLKESLEREKELRETIKLYSEVRQEAERARTEARTLKLQVAELESAQQQLKEELLSTREKMLNSSGGSSGESLSVPIKSQIDFLTKRLSDTEKKLDQAVAQLKEEQAKNQSNRESERLAFQDSLTGLPNQNMIRRYLDYSHQQALGSGRALGLFLIDLDDFRVLNKAYGRDWGDSLLKAVGERLNGMRGGSHMVARHSQDRFMLLAADLERAQLASFVDQASRSLLDALAYPFEVKGEQVKVTGSVGVCVGPVQGENPGQLYKRAEEALKVAKRSGPGRYTLFDDSLLHSLKKESTYKSQMIHAVEKSEFKAVYQPVYDLQQRRIMGLELLIRWERRDQTVLKPAEFLDAATASGSILKITEKLWPRAFALMARWQRMRKGLTLSINLCDKELLSPSLLQRTTGMVRQAGLDPGTIFFEVRDQSELRNSASWWEVLQVYAQEGFGLCLDDYGSDASLFGTLGFHGFRQAKVVVDERYPILSPSLQARKDLQYCAKGLEHKFDKKGLARAGFQQAQGYAISHPIGEAEVEGLLS